jgi:hypothetical protein
VDKSPSTVYTKVFTHYNCICFFSFSFTNEDYDNNQLFTWKRRKRNQTPSNEREEEGMRFTEMKEKKRG